MCKKLMPAIRILVIASVGAIGGAEILSAQSTTRASVDSQGGQGNYESILAAVSANGRFVAFTSLASTLVPGDTNDTADTFVHDMETGETTRVSVDSYGRQADDGSDIYYPPSISADGRFVAFASHATNLVPGDTNERLDIFVHDRQNGETTRVSVDSQGGQSNQYSLQPSISADGRLVAFESAASNLVSGDTNNSDDVFVHDRETGETTRVSVSSQGNQGNSYSVTPALSADGRFVAFGSEASNLIPDDTNGHQDIFVHDCSTGETARASVSSLGEEANLDCVWPSISQDGRLVCFSSGANNLVPNDTNWFDVFVHDRETGETTRVSVSSRGEQADGTSDYPAISADGQIVVFESNSSNLVPGANEWMQVYLHDRGTGETSRVSESSTGEVAKYDCDNPAVSGDGRLVAYHSWSDNLVPGDTNVAQDVFVRDRTPGPCSIPASWTSYGSGWPGTSGIPELVARSNPILCATLEVFAASSSGTDTTGVLFAGFNSANFPTPWDGAVLLVPSLARPVLMPAGGLSITAPIPCDEALCGLRLFAQVVEMDAGASRGVSFTPGLELRLGAQ